VVIVAPGFSFHQKSIFAIFGIRSTMPRISRDFRSSDPSHMNPTFSKQVIRVEPSHHIFTDGDLLGRSVANQPRAGCETPMHRASARILREIADRG